MCLAFSLCVFTFLRKLLPEAWSGVLAFKNSFEVIPSLRVGKEEGS